MRSRGRVVAVHTPEDEARREKQREEEAREAAERERARLRAEREETESWRREAIGESSFENELRRRR